MTLYEITQDMLELETLWNEAIDEETGEILNADLLEQIEQEITTLLVSKSENIIKYFRNEEALIKALKEEEKRLSTNRKRKEKKLEGFKNYIETNMKLMKTKKIETSLGNIAMRKSIQTVVDESVIPFNEVYAKKEEVVKYDKATLKKMIESGEKIEGVELVENFSVSIK